MARDDARAREIVARLSEGTASADEVLAAFEELDRLPADVVKSAFEPWLGPAPDPERLDDALRRAHRLPLRVPRLRVLSSMHDADVLDLGPLAEEQIRVAGRTWDHRDVDAFERLDGENPESFAGSLERRVLGEEGGVPLFDAVLFGENAGVVFRAGTTQIVAVLADGLVESTDRSARPALEIALRDHLTGPKSVEEPVPSTVTTGPAPSVEPVLVRIPQPPPPSEPMPSTVAVHVPVRDARQVELPFDMPPETKPSKVVAEPVSGDEPDDEAPTLRKKKKTAAKKTTVAAAAPKKKAATKKKAAAAPKAAAPKKKAAAAPKKKAAAAKEPAAKKKTATKKKTAAKKKKSSNDA